MLGDPRTNQNPAILAIGIVFFRYHNVIASRIEAEHPQWSDEEIFQRARRIVVAVLQVRTISMMRYTVGAAAWHKMYRLLYYCHYRLLIRVLIKHMDGETLICVVEHRHVRVFTGAHRRIAWRI